MHSKLILALGALLVLTSGAKAANEQFQIKVPVAFDLISRQDVSGSAVICEAHAGADMSDATLIGTGRNNSGPSGFIDPNKHASNMDVYVRFNADAGKDPTTATHYRCYIELQNAGSKCIPGQTDPAPDWCKTTGADDVLEVTGAF